MTKNLSNMCFGLAFGSSLLMKSFYIQDELVGLAVFSVLISALLTHLMLIRSIGIVGVSGFSLIYFMLGSSSLPGSMLTIMSAILLVFAVLLAIYADTSQPITSKKGEENKNEI